jgi:hypothetical protein
MYLPEVRFLSTVIQTNKIQKGASDIVITKSGPAGEHPKATGVLVSDLPYPRFSETQHMSQSNRKKNKSYS